MLEHRAPLAGQSHGGAIRIAVAEATGMVGLRADLATLPFPVPPVRRVIVGAQGPVLWMAPDELLLLCPPADAPALAAALDAHGLAADVSDARVLFRLTGADADVRAVLAKGAPVDLDPHAFGPGDLRRTRLGQVAVAFWCEGDGAFALLAARSVADYVFAWLCVAARPGSLPG